MSSGNREKDRVFKGPGKLSVYVPPLPATKSDTPSDFPPGHPPEVYYDTVKANYWVVCRTGQMTYKGKTRVFTDDEMQWLKSIEDKVEELLRG
jgi:hypothetical protein